MAALRTAEDQPVTARQCEAVAAEPTLLADAATGAETAFDGGAGAGLLAAGAARLGASGVPPLAVGLVAFFSRSRVSMTSCRCTRARLPILSELPSSFRKARK